jgi:hypothetical protein
LELHEGPFILVSVADDNHEIYSLKIMCEVDDSSSQDMGTEVIAAFDSVV